MKRGLMISMGSVAALGVFAAAVTVAYRVGYQAGGKRITPIIVAGDAPLKVRPTDPGGMKFPNQDKTVYGRLSSNGGDANGRGENGRAEKVMPAGERPIESLLLTIKPATAPPARTEQPVETAQAEPESVLPPRVDLPPPPPPKKSIPTPPGGSVVVRQATPEQAPPKPPEKLIPPVAKSATSTRVLPPVKADAAGSSPAAKPAPPVAAPQIRVATAPQPPKTPAPGGFLVQLASSKSEVGAKQTWARLRRAHPEIFGPLTPSIQKSYLGAAKGTWYRLRAGTFASRDTANRVCAQAKQRKVACFVVRR